MPGPMRSPTEQFTVLLRTRGARMATTAAVRQPQPCSESLDVSVRHDVAVGTRSSAPANPPEQFVCSDCGLCVLVRNDVAVGTHALAPANPPEQFIVGAQDKRTPHGHSRRGQPAMKCAGSLRVSARHGVAVGTRASGPENPLEQFIVLFRTRGCHMVTAGAASQP